ncbi:hypothetical protein JZ751_021190 [Albula glossodonta]|uniref:Uncharacterized protein n=1 Tax=Albula glossodonta TaxID=121402 RepID=A0A8T2NKR6_9TELE|nr:hypothetical protein JZ751_021190 [Albula glossodonta]
MERVQDRGEERKKHSDVRELTTPPPPPHPPLPNSADDLSQSVYTKRCARPIYISCVGAEPVSRNGSVRTVPAPHTGGRRAHSLGSGHSGVGSSVCLRLQALGGRALNEPCLAALRHAGGVRGGDCAFPPSPPVTSAAAPPPGACVCYGMPRPHEPPQPPTVGPPSAPVPRRSSPQHR